MLVKITHPSLNFTLNMDSGKILLEKTVPYQCPFGLGSTTSHPTSLLLLVPLLS